MRPENMHYKAVADSQTLNERKPTQSSFKLYHWETRHEGRHSVALGGGNRGANFYKYLTTAKSERNIKCVSGMTLCNMSCFGMDLTGSWRNFKVIWSILQCTRKLFSELRHPSSFWGDNTIPCVIWFSVKTLWAHRLRFEQIGVKN